MARLVVNRETAIQNLREMIDFYGKRYARFGKTPKTQQCMLGRIEGAIEVLESIGILYEDDVEELEQYFRSNYASDYSGSKL